MTKGISHPTLSACIVTIPTCYYSYLYLYFTGFAEGSTPQFSTEGEETCRSKDDHGAQPSLNSFSAHPNMDASSAPHLAVVTSPVGALTSVKSNSEKGFYFEII